jgi:hypothetical protein
MRPLATLATITLPYLLACGGETLAYVAPDATDDGAAAADSGSAEPMPDGATGDAFDLYLDGGAPGLCCIAKTAGYPLPSPYYNIGLLRACVFAPQSGPSACAPATLDAVTVWIPTTSAPAAATLMVSPCWGWASGLSAPSTGLCAAVEGTFAETDAATLCFRPPSVDGGTIASCTENTSAHCPATMFSGDRACCVLVPSSTDPSTGRLCADVSDLNP